MDCERPWEKDVRRHLLYLKRTSNDVIVKKRKENAVVKDKSEKLFQDQEFFAAFMTLERYKQI